MVEFAYKENGVLKLAPIALNSYDSQSVGSVVGFPGDIPSGYLLCDGSRFNENVYPELYAYLHTNVLPDYRECVLVGAGQNTTDSIATHDVYTVGQFKDDQLQNITGKCKSTWEIAPGTVTNTGALMIKSEGSVNRREGSGSLSSRLNVIELDASRIARAGTTTHGKQKGLNWAIKATVVNYSAELNPIMIRNTWVSIMTDLLITNSTANVVLDKAEYNHFQNKMRVCYHKTNTTANGATINLYLTYNGQNKNIVFTNQTFVNIMQIQGGTSLVAGQEHKVNLRSEREILLSSFNRQGTAWPANTYFTATLEF
jgi:hypothetical protein